MFRDLLKSQEADALLPLGLSWRFWERSMGHDFQDVFVFRHDRRLKVGEGAAPMPATIVISGSTSDKKAAPCTGWFDRDGDFNGQSRDGPTVDGTIRRNELRERFVGCPPLNS